MLVCSSNGEKNSFSAQCALFTNYQYTLYNCQQVHNILLLWCLARHSNLRLSIKHVILSQKMVSHFCLIIMYFILSLNLEESSFWSKPPHTINYKCIFYCLSLWMMQISLDLLLNQMATTLQVRKFFCPDHVLSGALVILPKFGQNM